MRQKNKKCRVKYSIPFPVRVLSDVSGRQAVGHHIAWKKIRIIRQQMSEAVKIVEYKNRV
jgi:hypothetical protein